MGLGVLNTKHGHVPGTSNVLDDANTLPEEITANHSRLKYDPSGRFILVPQPSDDPNDPLNWPLWRRDLIMFILSLVAVLCATATSLMAANALTLKFYFQTSFTEIALFTGYLLCGVGVAGILCVPTARIWGKRHLFLLGNLLMVISCIWAACSGTNKTSVIMSRVFQGVALAPFEALVNASVGDLYFVHERGKRMAFTNVALFGAAFLAPVIGGKISNDLSWQWTFWFLAIFSGAAFPFMFFFVPEVAYRRASHLNTDFKGDSTDSQRSQESHRASSEGTDTQAMQGGEITDDKEPLSTANGSGNGGNAHLASTSGIAPPQIPEKDSFVKSLRLFNGRKTDESFWKLFLRPFPLFLHPGILWACLTQGVLIGWTVFIGVTLAAIFLGPPLWFGQVQTGYLYTGAFIGSIVGLVLSAILSDSLNTIMIKLNKGVYEPEFRILLVIFQLVFGGMGIYGFGYVAGDVAGYGWLLPDVFLMFVIIGMVMGAVASALYIVDAHRQIAIEAFTCLLIFKNMFSFVLTFYAYNWLVVQGVRPAFVAVFWIQVAICLLSVPMYVFGKWNRAFFSRHDILKMCGLW